MITIIGVVMPFTYKIDTTLGLVFYTGFAASMAEMFQVERTASADPLRLPSMKIIIDLSEMQLDVSLADIKEAIKLNRARMEKERELEPTAIVSHSRFATTSGDIYRLLGENMPLHFGIFSTLSDAIRWLGLFDKEAEIIVIQKELLRQLR
jgi:hypothetical protein